MLSEKEEKGKSGLFRTPRGSLAAVLRVAGVLRPLDPQQLTLGTLDLAALAISRLRL